MSNLRIVLVTSVMIAINMPAQVDAQSCSTANDYECPTGSSSSHRLYLSAFGPFDMSGPDTVWLGSNSSGGLSACYVICSGGTCSNNVVGLSDANFSGSGGSELQANSFFCAGASNDSVTILTATMNCGGTNVFPFISNGHVLTIYGNDGQDSLVGGTVTEAYLCGGPDNDSLDARYAFSSLDGWTGNDTLYQAALNAYEWGYDGNDTIRASGTSGSGGVAVLNGESGDDCILVFNYQTISMSCGSNTGTNPRYDSTNLHVGGGRPADCENTWPTCPADGLGS